MVVRIGSPIADPGAWFCLRPPVRCFALNIGDELDDHRSNAGDVIEDSARHSIDIGDEVIQYVVGG